MQNITEKYKLNISRSALFLMQFKVCLTYFSHDCGLRDKTGLSIFFRNDR